MSPAELRIRVVPAIRDIPAEAWNACANPTALHPVVAEARVKSDACPTALAPAQSFSQLEAYNPFISHDFLSSLESSDSVRPRTGSYLHADLLFGVLAGVAALAFLLFSPWPFPPVWILIDPIVIGLLAGLAASWSTLLRRSFTPLAMRRRRVETAARSTFVERRIHGTAGTDGVPGYTPPRRPGHIHRSHPLQDLLVLLVFDLLRLLHHHAPFRAPSASRKGAALGPRSESRESSERAPSNSARPKIKAPRQTVRLAHVPEKHRRQRATIPDFHARRASPAGTSMLLCLVKR